MNIDELHAGCLLRPLSDARFKKEMAVLNDRFTAHRNALTGYGDDAEQVSAYAAFYLPTNMKKLPFILSQLTQFPIANGQPLEVVDFGCGPGTYSFALYEYLQTQLREETRPSESPAISEWKPSEVTFRFVDTAPLMLQQARRIQEGMYPDMVADYHHGLPSSSPGTQRLMLFGNVMNELGADGFNAIFPSLHADVMICIEPGTLASFQVMSRIRRRVLEAGYRVLYPCSASMDCPIDGHGTEWCHQVLKASLEPAVARLGQLASLDRTVMPFIGHVYAKDSALAPRRPAATGVQRGVLFRLKTHSKHAFFWELCVQTPSGLQLQKVELSKRGLSKVDEKTLERISAGQRIAFEVVKELGDGSLRIGGVQWQKWGRS